SCPFHRPGGGVTRGRRSYPPVLLQLWNAVLACQTGAVPRRTELAGCAGPGQGTGTGLPKQGRRAGGGLREKQTGRWETSRGCGRPRGWHPFCSIPDLFSPPPPLPTGSVRPRPMPPTQLRPAPAAPPARARRLGVVVCLALAAGLALACGGFPV